MGMTLTDARKMAIDLMKKHHLHPKFSVKFVNMSDGDETDHTWLGYCDYSNRRDLHIALDKKFIKNNTQKVVKDVILHEVAHVLDFMIRGYSHHDNFFRLICKKIGCSGLAEMENVK
jgi:hypothetical protein